MRLHLGLIPAFAALCLALPTLADTGPELYAHTDSNKDGEIDRAEFQQRQKDVFFFQDDDKDGSLSVQELDSESAAEAMELGDRDGDGKLQLDEFLDTRARAFRRADTDKSGTLSTEEIGATEQ